MTTEKRHDHGHHATNGATNDYVEDKDINGAPLSTSRTAGSIIVTPEMFEKLYLQPQNRVKGDLRKSFANPTPLALAGFLLSSTPLSCILMGWRGAGGSGASGIGTYFFLGGLMLILGGFLEFILGNTFPFVVFCVFGGFWLSFAATLQPFYNAYGAFSPDPSNPAAGLAEPAFFASFGFFLIFMGFISLIFLVCSLRTNVAFVVIFLSLVLTFSFLTGSYWHTALGNMAMAARLQTGGGACLFVTSLSGWYIFVAQMLASVDFPLQIPVGDLSTMIRGGSQRNQIPV